MARQRYSTGSSSGNKKGCLWFLIGSLPNVVRQLMPLGQQTVPLIGRLAAKLSQFVSWVVETESRRSKVARFLGGCHLASAALVMVAMFGHTARLSQSGEGAAYVLVTAYCISLAVAGILIFRRAAYRACMALVSVSFLLALFMVFIILNGELGKSEPWSSLAPILFFLAFGNVMVSLPFILNQKVKADFASNAALFEAQKQRQDAKLDAEDELGSGAEKSHHIDWRGVLALIVLVTAFIVLAAPQVKEDPLEIALKLLASESPNSCSDETLKKIETLANQKLVDMNIVYREDLAKEISKEPPAQFRQNVIALLDALRARGRPNWAAEFYMRLKEKPKELGISSPPTPAVSNRGVEGASGGTSPTPESAVTAPVAENKVPPVQLGARLQKIPVSDGKRRKYGTVTDIIWPPHERPASIEDVVIGGAAWNAGLRNGDQIEFWGEFFSPQCRSSRQVPEDRLTAEFQSSLVNATPVYFRRWPQSKDDGRDVKIRTQRNQQGGIGLSCDLKPVFASFPLINIEADGTQSLKFELEKGLINQGSCLVKVAAFDCHFSPEPTPKLLDPNTCSSELSRQAAAFMIEVNRHLQGAPGTAVDIVVNPVRSIIIGGPNSSASPPSSVPRARVVEDEKPSVPKARPGKPILPDKPLTPPPPDKLLMMQEKGRTA